MKHLTVLVLFVSANSTLDACSCGPTPPVERELARSDSVFVGRVVRLAIEPRNSRTGSTEWVICQFDGIEAFKGHPGEPKQILVVTHAQGTACGFRFEIGERYLVYASKRDGDLETSTCHRTKPLVTTSAGAAALDYSGKIEADQVRALTMRR